MTNSIPRRNIAIIAHVDHGKTTLVDVLFRQSGTFAAHKEVEERAMDSDDIEKERGITILAKATSVVWKDTRINIVDTPGHADFGGEVERILNMVDGALLLVDAAEGVMPQTKFVVAKALEQGLRPIVVINKVDKPDARPDEILNQVFDLFIDLEATSEQLDFPVIYASGKEEWASEELEDTRDNTAPLLDKIVDHVPPPGGDNDKPLRMLCTLLDSDPYLGRILTGRVYDGTVQENDSVIALSFDGEVLEKGRVTKVLAFRGLDRVPVDQATAGDIIAIAGLQEASVADTIAAPDVRDPLKATPIDPPIITMQFGINTSPFAGKEGSKLTSRQLRDRLMREAEVNVAIQIDETESKDTFAVSGRGELQLAVLAENLRREGFELSISRPQVVFKTDDQGNKMEPLEEVVIDVDADYSGNVVQKLSERRADLIEMTPQGGGRQRLIFHAPSRGLIGYLSEFLTDTRGTGVMNRLFYEYGEYRGDFPGRRNGVLISKTQGVATAYALMNLEDRGQIMVEPGTDIYQGMIVGEHARENDLEVNVEKGKKLSNVRSSGKDDAVQLAPVPELTLEKAMTFIDDDELVEVTPDSIRLRKRHLDPNERKKRSRAAG